MPLKNHSNAPAHLLAAPTACTMQGLTKHRHLTLLNRPQGADQGEQCRLATARRTGQQNHFARFDAEADVLKNLAAHLPLTEGMGEVVDNNSCHQKISAGSASMRRRMARSDDSMHITKIITSTVNARGRSIPTGSLVASRTNQYRP